MYLRGLQLIAAVTDGDVIYYLHDGRGSVVQLVNTRGEVLQSYRYTAFGEEINPDENDANPWRHNAEYFDTSSGLYYLRHRFYNPATGRFLNEDPIRWGYNWYLFTSNNPIMFIDPWGLSDVAIAGFVDDRGGTFGWCPIDRNSYFVLGDVRLEIFWGADFSGFNTPGIDANWINERWYANELVLEAFFAFGLGPRNIYDALNSFSNADLATLEKFLEFLLITNHIMFPHIPEKLREMPRYIAVATFISFIRDVDVRRDDDKTRTRGILRDFFGFNNDQITSIGTAFSFARQNISPVNATATENLGPLSGIGSVISGFDFRSSSAYRTPGDPKFKAN